MSRALSPAGPWGRQTTRPRVHLTAEGRMAGKVEISRQDDVLLMAITVAPGHLPAATRRELVEQAFRLPELNLARQRLLVTIPLGDAELLQALRARLSEVRVRPAGATCLVEATVR